MLCPTIIRNRQGTDSRLTVGIKYYCKRVIFGVCDIWRTLNILSMDLIWRFINTIFIIVHLVMNLTCPRDTITKGAKRIHCQMLYIYNVTFLLVLSRAVGYVFCNV